MKHNTIWMKSILISENILFNYAKSFQSFKPLSIVHQCLGTDKKIVIICIHISYFSSESFCDAKEDEFKKKVNDKN